MSQRPYPEYFVYESRPVMIIRTPDGGATCRVHDGLTGEFVKDNTYIAKVRMDLHGECEEVDRDEFVQAVEKFRGRYVRERQGPVFALYDTITAMEETARDERRALRPDEAALIHTLRLRTHEMFEAMLREQGRPGTPPDGNLLHSARLFDGLAADGTPVVDRPAVPEAEREALLAYLEKAPIALAARGYDADLLDPARAENVPIGYHTDGAWVWPGATAYYLRAHGVAPDPALVEHIRARGFRLPEIGDDALRDATATITFPGQ